jgi:hypothetical protein
VWQSTGTIVQRQFAPIVDDALANGKLVNILTGVHGHADGLLEEELGFLDADVARWGSNPNANIQYIKALTGDQIRELLNSGDVTIGAFCNSAVCLSRFW